MDITRLGRGERIAGVSGVALFIFMYLNWFGVNLEIPEGLGIGIDASFNAWQAFSFIDLVLLLAVIVSVGFAVLGATMRDVSLPVALSALTAGIGIIATLLVIYRIIDPPGGEGIGREFGVWLGLIACVGITAGGWMAMQEEGTSFSGEAERFTGGDGNGKSGDGPPPPPSSGA